LFLVLPDRQDYADYYRFIANPIAMDMIFARMNSPYYASVQHFQQDFELMFSNALQYNVEGSDVYQDAIVLRNVFRETLDRSLSRPKQVSARIINSDDD
jgi:ATP-dependent helicase STH1/SNF2